jgi:hypothetical protein
VAVITKLLQDGENLLVVGVLATVCFCGDKRGHPSEKEDDARNEVLRRTGTGDQGEQDKWEWPGLPARRERSAEKRSQMGHFKVPSKFYVARRCGHSTKRRSGRETNTFVSAQLKITYGHAEARAKKAFRRPHTDERKSLRM